MKKCHLFFPWPGLHILFKQRTSFSTVLMHLISLGRGFEVEEILIDMNSFLRLLILFFELRDGVDFFFAIELEVGRLGI